MLPVRVRLNSGFCVCNSKNALEAGLSSRISIGFVLIGFRLQLNYVDVNEFFEGPFTPDECGNSTNLLISKFMNENPHEPNTNFVGCAFKSKHQAHSKAKTLYKKAASPVLVNENVFSTLENVCIYHILTCFVLLRVRAYFGILSYSRTELRLSNARIVTFVRCARECWIDAAMPVVPARLIDLVFQFFIPFLLFPNHICDGLQAFANSISFGFSMMRVELHFNANKLNNNHAP